MEPAGGDHPGGGGGFGGDSYTTTPLGHRQPSIKVDNRVSTRSEPSGRQSGPFVNTDSPSRIWIPQEPTIAGRGTKTINNEVPSSSKIFAGSGYTILRYYAKPISLRFQYSWVTSNLTPFIPGNGYEYYVMTSPGNVTITKSYY